MYCVHIQHQLLSYHLNDPDTVPIILFFGINTTDISSIKVVLYGVHSVMDLVVEYIAQNAGFAGWLLYQCCGIQVVVYKLWYTSCTNTQRHILIVYIVFPGATVIDALCHLYTLQHLWAPVLNTRRITEHQENANRKFSNLKLLIGDEWC